jgi:hypothetical protein
VSTCITPAGQDRYEQARPTQRSVLRAAAAPADAVSGSGSGS